MQPRRLLRVEECNPDASNNRGDSRSSWYWFIGICTKQAALAPPSRIASGVVECSIAATCRNDHRWNLRKRSSGSSDTRAAYVLRELRLAHAGGSGEDHDQRLLAPVESFELVLD